MIKKFETTYQKGKQEPLSKSFSVMVAAELLIPNHDSNKSFGTGCTLKQIALFVLACSCFVTMLTAQDTGNKNKVAPEDVRTIESVAPGTSSAHPHIPRNVMIFEKNNKKSVMNDYVDSAFVILGRKSGAFTITCITEDASVMTTATLRDFDAIIFNNTNELLLDDNQTDALQNFVKGGKGIFAVGSAISVQNWPEQAEMLGGSCLGHPFQRSQINTSGEWVIKIDDRSSPLSKALDPSGFTSTEIIYQIVGLYSRRNVHTLCSVDVNNIQVANINPEEFYRKDNDFAFSWTRDYGLGRVFFTQFAHVRNNVLFKKEILQHFLDGMQYVTGDLKVAVTSGATTPSIEKKGNSTQTIEECVALLHDKSTNVRINAAYSLSHFTTKSEIAIPVLLETLKDSSIDVRYFAALSLSKFGKPAITSAATLLNSEDPRLRSAAILTLKFSGTEAGSYLNDVIALLGDKDQSVKIEAIKTIGRIAQIKEEVVPILIETLKDTTFLIRTATFQAIGRMGVAAKDALPSLVTIVKNDPNSRIRRSATDVICAMSILPEAKDGIVLMTEFLNQDWQLASKTIAVFGKMGANAKPAIPALIDLTKNKRTETRGYAALALGETGITSNEVATALRDLLNDKEKLVRYNAAQALSKMGINVMDIMATMLGNDDWFIRLKACQGIGSIGAKAKSVLPELRKHIGDTDQEVRRTAIRSISEVEQSER